MQIIKTMLTGADNQTYDIGRVLAFLSGLAFIAIGLRQEHPDSTPRWCHVQIVPPGSGRRVFRP